MIRVITPGRWLTGETSERFAASAQYSLFLFNRVGRWDGFPEQPLRYPVRMGRSLGAGSTVGAC